MDYKKLAEMQRISRQLQERQAYLDAKEKALNRKANDLAQNILPTSQDPRDFKRNLQASFDAGMVPGNVGSLNSVIWPFFFVTPQVNVPINTNVKSGFSITQEATFVWMSYTKAVFTFDGINTFDYVDPDNSAAAGYAFGLSMTIRDSSSSRDFVNTPIEMDVVGNPRFPTRFPRPSMFLPNGNVEISFTNSHPTQEYSAQVIAFGYRLRVEDAQQILSLTYV